MAYKKALIFVVSGAASRASTPSFVTSIEQISMPHYIILKHACFYRSYRSVSTKAIDKSPLRQAMSQLFPKLVFVLWLLLSCCVAANATEGFVINGVGSAGEQQTATSVIQLRFSIANPASAATVLACYDNFGGGPATYTYSQIATSPVTYHLSGVAGLNTVYVTFTDIHGVASTTPVTQNILYYPQNCVKSGLRGPSLYYPIDTYDEYTDQNKYGGGLTDTATVGHYLSLTVP
ncbi:MAG: hypothetical protein HQM09_13045 [Candidatus Riflebacteria bacterium]|nr:hypothetical protein [Candidatus Riflebacteria bacterium]